MSSVGSSDNSNKRDEVVRRNREEYQAQQSEQTKKHQRELRRINEQHYAELEKLKSDHAAQKKAMADDSRDTINQQDYKYQQEMEDLRAIHRKQVQHLADEAAKREDRLNKVNEGAKVQREQQTDDRFEKLNEDYVSQLRQQEKLYQDNLKLNREEQGRSLDVNRKNQEDYHQREMSSVKKERDQSVNSLQKQYKDYRENAEGRLKGQEVKHMQENQKASNDLVRAVKKERALRVESEDILRDGFAGGLHDTRERFEEAMQRERINRDTALGNMKEAAVDRVENQVRRLELEKEDLKENKVRNELQLKQKQNREIANMRNAFQKNVENLAEQRDEAVRQGNERNREDILDVRKDMSKQMVNTNRFYRERMEDVNRINREAYETIRDDFAARNEQTKNTADMRVQRIHEETEDTKARLIEKQAEDHMAHQEIKHDEVKRIRAAMDMEKNAAVRRVQDQMRKQEVQHTEKMASAVNKYEKQITMLKDQMLKERKAAEDNLKRTVQEMQHAHQVAIDQLDAKNRDQARQTDLVHSEQVRALNKRHEEKLDQVITEVKKA